MNPAAAQQQYLKAKVFTATPEQLQLMLYDGAIRFAEKGRLALEKSNFEESYTSLSRAQKIIVELSGSLRHSIAPELCGKLASLYNYVYRKLVQGSAERNVAAVDEGLVILRHQRETWMMLLDQLGKTKAAAAANQLDIPSPDSRMEMSISMQG
ncbi:MAG: flagellar export chaperone FliS [Phycisphaerae bacterium]|nr:flagellar export chaperone FliS [Phycisphaerae bacterium]